MERVWGEAIVNKESAERWAIGWAAAGATAWAAVAVLARVGAVRIGVIELMFLIGPLVIVPLGLELGRIGVERIGFWGDMAQSLQPLGAIFAVVATVMGPGFRAGALACGWMVVCGCAAVAGALELFSLQQSRGHSNEASASKWVALVAIAVAKIDLAVGGAWLVASRLGMRPIGIQEPIGLLTAVHFHFAGFATAMIASATVRFAARNGQARWLQRVVLAILVLPFVVAIGFVISPVLKMVAAAAFSIAVAVFAGFMWSVSGKAESRQARMLMRIATGAIFVGMGLSSGYAVTDFLKSDALTIPRMASTHGILNAVGFCLVGLLGWLVESAGAVGAKE